jgi:hypothetical protein
MGLNPVGEEVTTTFAITPARRRAKSWYCAGAP